MSRTLFDLFVIGKELTIEDGQGGDPVVLWIQKMNSVENEKALKAANAAKAGIMALKRVKGPSEDKEVYMQQIETFVNDRDDAIEFLAAEEIQRAAISREAEIGARDEWAEEDYLESLREAWESKLSDVWVANPEEPEAKRVYDELKRFQAQVEELVDVDRKVIARKFASLSEDKLKKQVLDSFIDVAADMEWVNTYRKYEVYYGTRHQEDHTKLYFTSVEQVDLLTPQVFNILMVAFKNLNVEPLEGKG